MKERPILFSGPMVRAILEGKKTQTRRIVKPQPCLVDTLDFSGKVWIWHPGKIWKTSSRSIWVENCPYGVPGDRLWVRETWGIGAQFDTCKPSDVLSRMKSGKHPRITYRADGPELNFHRWRPSIHMPRWASRLTPEVISVRPERLQDITEDDIIAEGISLINGKGWHNPVDNRCYPRAEWAFKHLWNSINAKRGYGWDVNPWVWAISLPRQVEREAI